MTTKKIKDLSGRLKVLESEYNREHGILTYALQQEYNKVFDKDTTLQAALKELSESNEYARTESGDISQWTRFSFDAYKESLIYLEQYLSDGHCVYMDRTNDTLYSLLGPEIIIYSDGDVFDEESHKVIIEKKDYDTATERNELIEKHMETSGYYPGVFREDKHGNIFPVNLHGEK